MSTEIVQTAVTTGKTGEDAAQGRQPAGFFASAQFDPYAEDLAAEAGVVKQDKWSVSWADLMMTMFVLFTVLYAYQAGNRRLVLDDGPGVHSISESGAGRVADLNALHNPTDIYDRAREAFLDEFVNDSVGVDMVSDRAVRISIAGDILFDTGMSELRPQARERLRQIAPVLRDSNYIINVSGHTDAMPNYSEKYPTNWELSAARATETARFLIEKEGIPEERFFISAHSWHQPVQPNNSMMNRRQNRRVEIILMKERPYLKSAPQ
ncbi:MAG: flagellar motor protein MotB [Desulfobacter sp.]|nr:MAG: flagellar motor protein MotB [Desulfobacter sp.]